MSYYPYPLRYLLFALIASFLAGLATTTLMAASDSLKISESTIASTDTIRQTSLLSETVLVTTTRQTQVFAVPGEPYPLLVTYAAGLTFSPSGRSQDGEWLVLPIGLFQQGWAAKFDLTVSDNVDTLPIIIPEYPELPTPTISTTSLKIYASAGKADGTVRLTVSGAQFGVIYIIEVKNSRGNTAFKDTFKAQDDTVNRFIYAGTLGPGSYTVIITGQNGTSSQTLFTIEKKP